MKNAIVLITCLFSLVNFNANAQLGYLKKAAKKVSSTAKKVSSTTKTYATKGGKKVWGATKAVGGTTKTYATKGGKKVWGATKIVGGTTKTYATKGGKKVWGATKAVGGTTKTYATKGGKKVWGATKAVGGTTKTYATKGGKKVWGATKTVGGLTKKYATKGGKLVFEGGKSFAGVIVSSGGTILVQGYGIAKEVVVNGRIPRYRRVTEREYDFANKHLFGGTLPARSKILVSNLLGVGNREFVWPTGTGHFLMNMGSSGYNNGLYDEGLFIHEITHVWQLHVTDDINWTIAGITSQIKNSATDENVYSVDCNDNWGSMNLEQQATVAERGFNYRKNGTFEKCYEVKVIEHIRNGNGFD